MIDMTNKRFNYLLLRDCCIEGYTSITMHIEATKIPVPMERMKIYDMDMNPLDEYLDVETFIEVMGHLQTGMKGYFVHDNTVTIHFAFDEKLINGKREQDYLIELLKAHGFVNARDLNNDGINDREIENIDWDKVPEKFFIFYSKREAKLMLKNKREIMT